jgi:hypothetical protein
MPKFIVISYDKDEEQTFREPVIAKNHESARKLVKFVHGKNITILIILDIEDILEYAGVLSERINHLNGDLYITHSNANAKKAFWAQS